MSRRRKESKPRKARWQRIKVTSSARGKCKCRKGEIRLEIKLKADAACRNESHHFTTRLPGVLPAFKIWAASSQQLGWKRGAKHSSGFPRRVFLLPPSLPRARGAFLFNGNAASPDPSRKLLPNFPLLFLIRSHPRGTAGPSSAFHQCVPAPRSPLRVQGSAGQGGTARRGASRRSASRHGSRGREKSSPRAWEGRLLGDCREKVALPGGSVTGRGYARNRQGSVQPVGTAGRRAERSSGCAGQACKRGLRPQLRKGQGAAWLSLLWLGLRASRM